MMVQAHVKFRGKEIKRHHFFLFVLGWRKMNIHITMHGDGGYEDIKMRDDEQKKERKKGVFTNRIE